MVLVVERRGRITIHGKDLRVVDPEGDAEATAMPVLVRDTEKFFLCSEAEQRMLLAIAGLCDGHGIASGWDPETGLARGVSVASLALKAGLPRDRAEEVLTGLCDTGRDLVCRLVTKHPPYGLVWVLLGVDVEAVPA